jgi:hypothetical protein
MGVPWPAAPGPGQYPLPLDAPGLYLLLLLLGTFLGMLWLLYRYFPGRRRATEGFYEAAYIDVSFLIFGLVLVLALGLAYAHGNRTSLALYRVVLGGYWFTFSIPIVTVGLTIHRRSRGGVPWRYPAVVAAGLLFVGLFAFYYAVGPGSLA